MPYPTSDRSIIQAIRYAQSRAFNIQLEKDDGTFIIKMEFDPKKFDGENTIKIAEVKFKDVLQRKFIGEKSVFLKKKSDLLAPGCTIKTQKNLQSTTSSLIITIENTKISTKFERAFKGILESITVPKVDPKTAKEDHSFKRGIFSKMQDTPLIGTSKTKKVKNNDLSQLFKNLSNLPSFPETRGFGGKKPSKIQASKETSNTTTVSRESLKNEEKDYEFKNILQSNSVLGTFGTTKTKNSDPSQSFKNLSNLPSFPETKDFRGKKPSKIQASRETPNITTVSGASLKNEEKDSDFKNILQGNSVLETFRTTKIKNSDPSPLIKKSVIFSSLKIKTFKKGEILEENKELKQGQKKPLKGILKPTRPTGFSK